MDHETYIRTVLSLYVRLPGSPRRVRRNDRVLAEQWFARQIPIDIVETALLVGTGRRICRHPNALKLAPVRSIAYFAAIVEELLDQPPPKTYIQYLRDKLGVTPSINTG